MKFPYYGPGDFVTIPETPPVLYQICPKCNGHGHVSKPPYLPGDVTTWESSSFTSFECDVCKGEKTILAPEQHIESSFLPCPPPDVLTTGEGFIELPPFLCHPTRIMDELETDVDVNAVPGGPELWQRVRNREIYFTRQEVYFIYSMLGIRNSELPWNLL